MSEKLFISADELYRDSFSLAHKIYSAGFFPDFLVALWRGGTPVGIVIQEFLDFHEIPTDHIAIRTSFYTSDNKPGGEVRIHGTDYLLKKIQKNHRLLIVDDVFDTGLTIEQLIKFLNEKKGNDCPEVIKTATLFYKPKNRKANLVPDFFMKETSKWLVFPHELAGLNPEEIKKGKDSSVINLLKSK